MRVRYGDMLLVGTFNCQLEGVIIGAKVLVRTERGCEAGVIVQILGEPKPEQTAPPAGHVVRVLSESEVMTAPDTSCQQNPKEYEFCQKLMSELKLPMSLVHVERLLGGERLIFYFMSEGRVDFRELVKQLAKEYKTRIEMRQIGVRDETRLLGSFGHCGTELCCRKFLKDLQPVTMKMAKGQKTTLDPTKISGRCGRLMCCLGFEEENYAKLREEMPRKGTRVITPKGRGEVTDVELLIGNVVVELEKGDRTKFAPSEIKVDLEPEKGAQVSGGPGPAGEQRPPASGPDARPQYRPDTRAGEVGARPPGTDSRDAGGRRDTRGPAGPDQRPATGGQQRPPGEPQRGQDGRGDTRPQGGQGQGQHRPGSGFQRPQQGQPRGQDGRRDTRPQGGQGQQDRRPGTGQQRPSGWQPRPPEERRDARPPDGPPRATLQQKPAPSPGGPAAQPATSAQPAAAPTPVDAAVKQDTRPSVTPAPKPVEPTPPAVGLARVETAEPKAVVAPATPAPPPVETKPAAAPVPPAPQPAPAAAPREGARPVSPPAPPDKPAGEAASQPAPEPPGDPGKTAEPGGSPG
ncbi:MAG: regulatory iron-sulfur-containing complex subunit RicT [Planctomycetota bacterium]|nr:regulatory iron-sulfur-containing complex subunit RicT [Planctomycetota bacterium]